MNEDFLDELLEEPRYLMIDQIYAQVIKRFRKLNYINLFYAVTRTVLAVFFYIFGGPAPGLESWLWMAMVQGVLAAAYFKMLIEETADNETMVELGIEFYHTFMITEEELEERRLPPPNYQDFDSLVFPTFDFNMPDEESSRSTQVFLLLQLQFQANKLTRPIQLVSILQFSMFVSLQIFGMFLYLGGQVEQGTWLGYFFNAFMLSAIYLYIQIYIMVVLTIIFLPVFAIYSCYNLLLGYIRRKRLERLLTARPFKPEEPGDCSICISQFVKDDPCITLPCRHRYHEQCIREWLSRSYTCPICRVNLVLYSS